MKKLICKILKYKWGLNDEPKSSAVVCCSRCGLDAKITVINDSFVEIPSGMGHLVDERFLNYLTKRT